MTLLKSLPASYEYLITIFETMLMKELKMEYMMARLIYEISKHKEKETQGENVMTVSHQTNGRFTFMAKHKNVFILWQMGPNCAVLL